MADREYTVALREAVQILGKKPATVRSYVRSGRLSKQYVDGFNGQEMRLNKEELEELKQSLKDTTEQTAGRVSSKGAKQGDNEGVSHTVSAGVSDSNVGRAIELLEKQLEELRKEKDELRHESKDLTDKNFHMAGQLGYFQNQVETLKDQVKQLSAPAESGSHSKKKQGGFFSNLFGTKK